RTGVHASGQGDSAVGAVDAGAVLGGDAGVGRLAHVDPGGVVGAGDVGGGVVHVGAADVDEDAHGRSLLPRRVLVHLAGEDAAAEPVAGALAEDAGRVHVVARAVAQDAEAAGHVRGVAVARGAAAEAGALGERRVAAVGALRDRHLVGRLVARQLRREVE